MSYKGKGFYEAKAFLEMIQLIGPELSNAVKTIDEKNVALRGLHNRLNEIDNILDSGEFENDLTEEEEKTLLEESKNVIKTEQAIEDEVNPEVNA
jgi:archaellum biogenesis protein FlaJ (TadC family)